LLAILCLVGSLLVALAVASLLHSYTDNLIALNTVPLLAGALAMTMVGIAIHPVASWRSLGLWRGGVSGAARGVLLGAAACGLLVGANVICGLAEWTPLDSSQVRFDWRDARLAGLSFLAIGSVGEELFMRGLLLQFLACALGPTGAVALTSLVFALLHGANPSVTNLAQLNTVLFGATFGLAVVRHRSLWLAIGLHLGWNVAQVALGANNSGITIRLTDLNLELQGEKWLTGGEYGLEGGVLASGAALALAAAVWWLPRSYPAGGMLWESGQSPVPADSGGDPGGPLGLSAGPEFTDSAGEERKADDRSSS
jgi:membrane protease YdiL (CAAX protease family)